MNIFSFVEDRLDDLKLKMNKKEEELKQLEKTSVERLWEIDLDNFEKHYL